MKRTIAHSQNKQENIRVIYFLKNLSRKLKVPVFISSKIYKLLMKQQIKRKLAIYKKEWLVEKNGETYFDINGAKIPDVSSNIDHLTTLISAFEDTFTIPYFYHDNHDKSIVETVDKKMLEGPYGYTDHSIDVTVKKGDVVIDAGAWIGDFSAYAVSKGAIAYAFEPVLDSYKLLCKTAELNETGIYPIQKGLGSHPGEMEISISKDNSGSNSFIMNVGNKSEKIQLTTIDKFIEENHITRVDFIKADIEGAEREMLKGATNVLKTFAPKLAICTYHLPDDPDVLEKMILEINPEYEVVHLSHKLFAAVKK